MNIKKGDYVTRKSYNHDTLFKVINIENGIYYLKGVEVRLLADSLIDDLKKVDDYIEDSFARTRTNKEITNENDYFYLPAKIVHIDAVFFDN